MQNNKVQNNKILTSCFILLSLFIISPADSWSKDTIVWGHSCIPPLYICEGDKVEGVAAGIEDILFENLKDYNHKRLSSNLERLFDNIKTQEDMLFCNVAIAKNPEREQFLYYSIPAAIVPPIHIFIRKDDLSLFGNQKIVSLDNLLKNKDLKFGYPSSRSFGDKIDNIIKNYQNNNNVYGLYSSDVAIQPLSMLLEKRIDYTIGGYAAIKDAAENLGIQDKILPLKISEKQDFLVLYIVCSKNSWGKEMINKINDILKKEMPTDRYFNCFKPFYDEAAKEEFKQEYSKLLVQPISQQKEE